MSDLVYWYHSDDGYSPKSAEQANINAGTGEEKHKVAPYVKKSILDVERTRTAMLIIELVKISAYRKSNGSKTPEAKLAAAALKAYQAAQ